MDTITVSRTEGQVTYRFYSTTSWIYVSVVFLLLGIPLTPVITMIIRLGEPDSLGCLILLTVVELLFAGIIVHFVKQFNDVLIDVESKKLILINNLPVWKRLIGRRI